MRAFEFVAALLALTAAAPSASASRSIIAETDRTCASAPWRIHQVPRPCWANILYLRVATAFMCCPSI